MIPLKVVGMVNRIAKKANANKTGGDDFKIDDGLHTHVDRMTNWQRHQYAMAGYPPHRRGEFARMQRPADR